MRLETAPDVLIPASTMGEKLPLDVWTSVLDHCEHADVGTVALLAHSWRTLAQPRLHRRISIKVRSDVGEIVRLETACRTGQFSVRLTESLRVTCCTTPPNVTHWRLSLDGEHEHPSLHLQPLASVITIASRLHTLELSHVRLHGELTLLELISAHSWTQLVFDNIRCTSCQAFEYPGQTAQFTCQSLTIRGPHPWLDMDLIAGIMPLAAGVRSLSVINIPPQNALLLDRCLANNQSTLREMQVHFGYSTSYTDLWKLPHLGDCDVLRRLELLAPLQTDTECLPLEPAQSQSDNRHAEFILHLISVLPETLQVLDTTLFVDTWRDDPAPALRTVDWDALAGLLTDHLPSGISRWRVMLPPCPSLPNSVCSWPSSVLKEIASVTTMFRITSDRQTLVGRAG